MRERRYEIVLCRRERDQLTLEGLAATAKIHPGGVERFVALGLLEPVEWAGSVVLFDAAAVPGLQTILRLRRNTGVYLAGIVMILEMLDRLRSQRRTPTTIKTPCPSSFAKWFCRCAPPGCWILQRSEF